MHSSKPQQVRRRDFDTELYDGTYRPSFPFVKWIGELIESMGASHIMDTIRYPDHAPSESLILSKIAHEAKESFDAFKRAYSRWEARTIQWNTDTIFLDRMGGQWDQQAGPVNASILTKASNTIIFLHAIDKCIHQSRNK